MSKANKPTLNSELIWSLTFLKQFQVLSIIVKKKKKNSNVYMRHG